MFGPRQCDRIIELGQSLPAEGGRVLDGSPGELRDCTVRWLPSDESTEWIRERLSEVAHRANRRWGFDLGGGGEDLQLTTYAGPGTHYTWHQDGLDRDVRRRKLSVVVQLSDPDDYTGGDLEFLEVVEDYDARARAEYDRSVRRRGCAVVFPSFEYHRVTPLRSGIRHSLVWWLDGPPFR